MNCELCGKSLLLEKNIFSYKNIENKYICEDCNTLKVLFSYCQIKVIHKRLTGSKKDKEGTWSGRKRAKDKLIALFKIANRPEIYQLITKKSEMNSNEN
jgi:hypothetical protein